MIIKIPKYCSDVVKEVFVVKAVGSLQYYWGQKIIEEQIWSEPGDGHCDGDVHVDDHDDIMMKMTTNLGKTRCESSTQSASHDDDYDDDYDYY